jgi:uncharacterized cupredoxin-like copper-binding protein
MKNLYVLAVVVVVGLAAVAVGAALAGGSSSAKLSMKLREMSISPTRVHAPTGNVTLTARNLGSIEHELVVVRAPRSGKLRIDHYRADEAAAVGEVEELAPGKTGHVTLKLKAGRYVLLCNIPGHYQLGMSAELIVGK